VTIVDTYPISFPTSYRRGHSNFMLVFIWELVLLREKKRGGVNELAWNGNQSEMIGGNERLLKKKLKNTRPPTRSSLL
jgi:hypothetical protein